MLLVPYVMVLLSMAFAMPRNPVLQSDVMHMDFFNDTICLSSTGYPHVVINVEKCSPVNPYNVPFTSFDNFPTIESYYAHCDVRGDIEVNVCKDKNCAECLTVFDISETDKGKCLALLDDKIYYKTNWTCPEYKHLELLKQD